MSPRKVLFLCTGNYYRSRFAELLFNARAADLNWSAESRGLGLDRGPNGNVGPISEYTIAGLRQRQVLVAAADLSRRPQQVTRHELATFDLVIALKEAEHRPMLESRHPDFAHKVEYWHIHDLDQASAPQALSEIETRIDGLITRLGALG